MKCLEIIGDFLYFSEFYFRVFPILFLAILTPESQLEPCLYFWLVTVAIFHARPHFAVFYAISLPLTLQNIFCHCHHHVTKLSLTTKSLFWRGIKYFKHGADEESHYKKTTGGKMREHNSLVCLQLRWQILRSLQLISTLQKDLSPLSNSLSLCLPFSVSVSLLSLCHTFSLLPSLSLCPTFSIPLSPFSLSLCITTTFSPSLSFPLPLSLSILILSHFSLEIAFSPSGIYPFCIPLFMSLCFCRTLLGSAQGLPATVTVTAYLSDDEHCYISFSLHLFGCQK